MKIKNCYFNVVYENIIILRIKIKFKMKIKKYKNKLQYFLSVDVLILYFILNEKRKMIYFGNKVRVMNFNIFIKINKIMCCLLVYL